MSATHENRERHPFGAILLLSLTALLTACGPLTSPMPRHLEERDQLMFDDAWNQAMTPPFRVERQALLDGLLMQAMWEFGVDRIEYRSEKDIRGGVVVMEVHYVRTLPNEDCFKVTVLDESRRTLRTEVYSRADLEQTQMDLAIGCGQPAPQSQQATPEEQARETQRVTALRLRAEAARALFPMPGLQGRS